ncbi:hypothetical protein WCU98_24125 [Pectobacterium parmentieri]|uniref:hypothetical protein n=1 Tax=Pectobacterium parmentieri TaxID=1905730 RepID=UPI0018DF8AF3|nr:hypothetical protein [Pectobacterium parmentieri]MBI0471352.1 hypothetical protein [Pectobacterium parmentieri]MBI0493964.1 hypothetical protein [Pectobacterium parmentieri]MCL6381923.1 hypothetical protein [Pectobacterium parmentieri]
MSKGSQRTCSLKYDGYTQPVKVAEIIGVLAFIAYQGNNIFIKKILPLLFSSLTILFPMTDANQDDWPQLKQAYTNSIAQ